MLKQKQAVQLRLRPLLDRVEFASSPEIVTLTNSIRDAGLLITHMGMPKTPAEGTLKAELEARRAKEQQLRADLVTAQVGPETYAAIDQLKVQFKPIDEQLAALPKPLTVYAGSSYFDRMGTFRPALVPRPVTVLGRGSVSAPGAPASPGALSAVSTLIAHFPASSDEGARRAALALD